MTDRTHQPTLDSLSGNSSSPLDTTKHGAGRKSRAFACLVIVPPSALLMIAACVFILSFTAAHAVDVPVDSVAQVTFDDDGEKLQLPTAVFFDPVMKETYLVNGGTSRIIVYGPNFFPRVSIGIGRGVISPRGVTVLPNGEVYLTQVRNYKNPSPRITVLNAAFFVEREIFLDQIPEAADFMPKQLAVSSSGLIYLAGNDERGVLVFDEEGNFLRKFRVMDDISLLSPFTEAETEQAEDDGTEPGGEQIEVVEEAGVEQGTAGEQTDKEQIVIAADGGGEPAAVELTDGEATSLTSVEDDFLTNIPEEFRPRRKREDLSLGIVDGKGPVKLNAVMIDSRGRIYLLSAETGKIYVHGSDEALLFAFGTAGGSPGQLSQPRSLTIDENRELIYVVDYMRHTVLTYNLDGEFLFEVGGRGVAPGWYNFPASIDVNSDGQLLVADFFNRRLQVLEVGYEEALPYLELERQQGEETFIEEDEPEETIEDDLAEDAEGIDAEEEPEFLIESEQKSEDEPGDSLEEDVESIEQSAPEPADVLEAQNIIIEEVIIEDVEPAGFSEEVRESESPSGPSSPGANAGE